MFSENTPQWYKAIGFTFLGLALIAGSAAFQGGGQVFWAVFLCGLLFVVFGVAEAIRVNFTTYANLRERHLSIQNEIIKSLSQADPDVRNAIGAWFPHYQFVYAGEPIICWQDTIVPIEIFREFVQESNAQYTVAQRKWKERGATYHRYWFLIYQKLVELGFVLEDTSAGSHSEMWNGRSYDRVWEMYMHYMPKINKLQELK